MASRSARINAVIATIARLEERAAVERRAIDGAIERYATTQAAIATARANLERLEASHGQA